MVKSKGVLLISIGGLSLKKLNIKLAIEDLYFKGKFAENPLNKLIKKSYFDVEFYNNERTLKTIPTLIIKKF